LSVEHVLIDETKVLTASNNLSKMQNFFDSENVVNLVNKIEETLESDKKPPTLMQILTFCYHKGIGVDVDQDKVFNYHKIMAEDNHPPSLCALSHCYKEGIGTQIDAEKGRQYLQDALDLGFPNEGAKKSRNTPSPITTIRFNKDVEVQRFENASDTEIDSDTDIDSDEEQYRSVKRLRSENAGIKK
jgi:TPR repeat protein